MEPGKARPHTSLSRLVGNPVLALQRAIGNRGTTQFLARDKKKNKGTFEHSVQIGKLGPIEVKESNAGEFTTKSSPDVLTVTTTKSKHSDELKRMSESKSQGREAVDLDDHRPEQLGRRHVLERPHPGLRGGRRHRALEGRGLRRRPHRPHLDRHSAPVDQRPRQDSNLRPAA